ncbi:MAG: ATP-binding protein, partial [Bacteroidota bacterium]
YTFAIEKFKDEMYVATDGGLATFDGVDFKIHNRKEIRYPVALLNRNDSILYIGSWLDGIITKEQKQIQNIYPDRINRILENDGKLLIFNTYRRYALLSFNQNYALDTIIDLNERFNKNRRIAIDSSRIYVSEANTIDTFTWKGEKLHDFPFKSSEKIEAMRAIDTLLFLGGEYGKLTWISKKNPKQRATYDFKKPYTIKHIEPYKKNQILVQFRHRAEYSSVYVVTFSEDFSKVIQTEPILTIKYGISDIFVDQDAIYIASYGNGIYKIFPSLLKSYPKNDYQIPVPKFSYENKDGNMVFATENVSYTLQERDTFIQQKNLFRLNTIFEFQDEYYFSSHDDLYNSKLEMVSSRRINNFLYTAPNDTIFHSKYWVSRFHNNDREDLFCIQNNRKDKKVNTGIYFKNDIYIGTQLGIKKYEKSKSDTWIQVNDSVLEANFQQRVVRKIVAYKDQLVIATPYEAYIYGNDQITPLQFNEEDIYINDTFVDDTNRMYFATNKGFWVLTDDFKYHFNTKNGTNSDNIYSFYQDSKGIIWIISGNGIMEFNPKLLNIAIPPKIEVHQTTIENDHAFIAFKSDMRYFTEAALFEYKINNSEWRKVERQALDMSNLKPGNYSVAFRGKRINSKWSTPEVVQFRIQPKWYQITVIKIFIFTMITFLLLGSLWYRLRVIKRRNATLSNEINRRIFLEHKVENLREEVARDFHDEIGNKIASVIGLSNNLKHSEKIASPKVDKITSLSKEIYHTAKDFVWSLNPKNNNIESLCRYLRDYGENFFDLFDEIDFLYQEIDIVPIDISYIKSRNIILAYKEILANILKHSQATKVLFRVYLENTTFTIQIQDNGVGIGAQVSDHGNGLKNIKKRMETIQANVHIENSEGVSYMFVLDLQDEFYKTNQS